jgi:hypothetical protein
VVLPTIFFFAYKDVRKLWLSLITCGFCSTATVSSRDNLNELNYIRKNPIHQDRDLGQEV